MQSHPRILTSEEISQLSPTFSRVLRERRIDAARSAAAKRLPRTRIERAMVSQLGNHTRLLLLCGGNVPTREGYPQTTIASGEEEL